MTLEYLGLEEDCEHAWKRKAIGEFKIVEMRLNELKFGREIIVAELMLGVLEDCDEDLLGMVC